MQCQKIKKMIAESFLKKSTIKDRNLYDVYCKVAFQLNMESMRTISKECIEMMALKRPVVATVCSSGWEIIGGFNTLFLAHEYTDQYIYILELDDVSQRELEVFYESEFSELLYYQLHGRIGYASVIDALKELSRWKKLNSFLSLISSTRRLARFMGVSRDLIRYQEKISDKF